MSSQVSFLIWVSLTFSCIMSPNLAMGIFFIEYQRDLGISASQGSTIYSVSAGLIFTLGPIYGALLKQYGPRKILLSAASLITIGYVVASQARSYAVLLTSLSIVRGVGVGLATLTTFTMVGQGYTTKRALANNVLVAGGSIGGIIAAPILSMAIQEYSWHGAMFLVAGFLLNMFPCVWMNTKYFEVLMKERIAKQTLKNKAKVIDSQNQLQDRDSSGTVNGEIKNTENKQEKKTNLMAENILKLFDVKLLSDPAFILFTVSNCGLQGVGIVQAMYLVRYAQYLGISDRQSSLFLSTYQAAFVTMCIIVGFVTSKMHTKASKTGNESVLRTSTIVFYLVLALTVAMTIPLLFPTYYGYLVYTIISGSLQGSVGTLPITIVAELFGSDRLASALGFRSLVFGLFTFTLPPLIGVMVDSNGGSYRPVQYVCICCGLFGAFLLKLVQWIIDKRSKRTPKCEIS